MLKIAVFASGRGSNFISLLNAIEKEKFQAKIFLLITNNANSGAIDFAKRNGIASIHINQKQFPSETEFNSELLNILKQFEINFIVLAGYMKLIGKEIIKEFKNRIINIHPALLPKFGGKGLYGENVHEAVLNAKEKFSGATVHMVDEIYDNGLIVLQDSVPVFENDTKETLAKRVLDVEHKLLPKVVELFANGKIEIENNKIKILK